MSFYCFETRQDRTLAPYPPPEFSQQIEKMSPSEIVDHIINTNIDQLTLAKIEKAIAVPLRQLISPRENRRRRCIPRPQNNFVLYRRNFHAVITRERGNSVAKNFKLISNEAAKHWSAESNEIKQLYELIADCAKKVHDCTYPQYVYQPKHKSSKKGANGTIFREVTVDSCGKKGEKGGKDTKDTKALEEARRDKITMTKSFVAATTFLSNLDVSQHSAKFTPIANLNHKGYTSKFSIASDMDNQKRQWRWAHYYNQNNPLLNPNNLDNPNSPPNSSNLSNPEDIQNDQNNQIDQIDQNNIKNDKNIQNIQNNNNQDNQNDSNEQQPSSSSPSSSSSKVNNNNNVNNIPPPKVNESIITHPSTPPSPPSMRLLPAIDIPISSNFLATYDRNVWSLVNGFTNI